MGTDSGCTWLGLEQTDGGWTLEVVPGLVSGANALFGGCATAAAITIGGRIAPQPVVWVSTHFGALARAGSVVDLRARTISSGRTMTHLEVVGECEGRESFTARIACGQRPPHDVSGQWSEPPPTVTTIDDGPPFEHPVHADSWAARFDWRLAGSGDAGGTAPWAAWWVRPREPMPVDVVSAVLCDYVTYGMGRALGRPMGGLSVDNVLGLRPLDGGDDGDGDVAMPGGFLLVVRPEWIDGGFGYGTARLFDAGGKLLAAGTQTVVMNDWDWRLPDERDA